MNSPARRAIVVRAAPKWGAVRVYGPRNEMEKCQNKPIKCRQIKGFLVLSDSSQEWSRWRRLQPVFPDQLAGTQAEACATEDKNSERRWKNKPITPRRKEPRSSEVVAGGSRTAPTKEGRMRSQSTSLQVRRKPHRRHQYLQCPIGFIGAPHASHRMASRLDSVSF